MCGRIILNSPNILLGSETVSTRTHKTHSSVNVSGKLCRKLWEAEWRDAQTCSLNSPLV